MEAPLPSLPTTMPVATFMPQMHLHGKSGAMTGSSSGSAGTKHSSIAPLTPSFAEMTDP